MGWRGKDKKGMRYFISNPTYCRGKMVYDKKGAMTVKNSRFKREHVELRIYECQYADHWHVTSQVDM